MSSAPASGSAGAVGDALAAAAFAGDYDACRVATDGALAASCRAASTVGIQQAIVAATVFYALAAVLYALAAPRLRQDLADTEAGL